jgi:hypothetical protein
VSKAREARRRQDRAKKAAGVALVCREALPLQDAPIGAGPSIDVLVAYVGETLRALAGGGADLSKTIAITIGSDHPSFLAGQTVIEAKAAKRKTVDPDPGDIAVPPADEADLDDDDESDGGLLASA